MMSKSPVDKQAKWGLLSWAFYDWASSAYSAMVETFILPVYFIKKVAENPESGTEAWGLAVGLTGLLIALLSPFLGAMADQEGNGKKGLIFLTWINILSCGALWFIQPEASYALVALLLFSTCTLSSELAFLFYNALLPLLSPKDQIGRWSGWGWGLGYLGGVVSLCLALWGLVDPNSSPFSLNHDRSEGVRAAFVLAAVWFALFSLPLFLTVRSTPSKVPLRQAFRLGLTQLKNSFRIIKNRGSLLRFFLARMFFIDGLITLFSFGGLFAAAKFGTSESQILLMGIALNLTAGMGAWILGWLDDRYGSKKIMLFSLVALISLTLWAIGAQSEREFWTAGLLLGLFVGPVQASSRSYLAKIAPKEMLGELFGFFNVSGKATSFLGPLMVSGLIAYTGSLSWAMYSIPLLLALGLGLLFFVKEEHAAQQ